MAMNFLGLGFSFGGRDKGMSKTIENQTKHLGLMGSAVKTLDKILSINRLQTFLEAVSLSRLKDISDGIENISSAGRNLTTDLESTFQSNSRSMAAFGVSVGKTGADLKKFKKETSAAAYATGIGIDEMGKAFYGFEPAAKMLSAMGIKSGREFAELAEVAGIDAQKFGRGLGQVQKQLGLSEEQMALMTAQAAKTGKSIGDLGGTLNGLPDMAEILNARKALGDSPEAITKFGQQVFGLGEALYAVGIQDALGMSKGVAKAMNDSKKSFQDLFAGVGDDLDSFKQELLVSGLDSKKVFGAMEQGPADFMKVLAEQVTQLEANGGDVGKALEFMRGRMSQTFGEEQTNQLVTALQDPVKRGAMAAIKLETDASNALGQIRKEGYESRFTAAESFERAEAMMVHRFRQISNKQAWQFVKNSQDAFKKFGDSLQKVAAEKGPLGAIVRKMSEAHQIGAQAFIPEVMRPLVTLTGSAVKEMGPLLGILGSLGFRFTMLLNPINLVLIAGGALLAWFAALRMSGKSTDVALSEMGVKLMNFFYSIPRYVDEALDALAGFISGGPKSNVWTQVFDMVWNSIKSAAAHIWTRMKEIAAGFWDGFTNNVKSANTKTSSEIIGEKLGAVLRGALDRAWANLKKGVMDLASGKATGEGVLAAALGLGTIMKFAGPVLKVLSVIVSLVGSIGSAVVSVASFLAPVVGALFTVQGAVIAVAVGFAALVAGFALWPTETEKMVGKVTTSLSNFASDAAELLFGGLVDAVSWYFSGGGNSIAQWLAGLPQAFYKFLSELAPAVGKALTSVLGLLEGLLVGALNGMERALVTRFPQAAGTIQKVFTAIRETVQFVFNSVKIGITTVTNIMSAAFNLMGHIFTTTFKVVQALLRGLGLAWSATFDAMKPYVDSMVSWIRDNIGPWISAFVGWLKDIWTKVQPFVQPIADFFKSLWDDIVGGSDRIMAAVGSTFESLKKVFDDTFGSIDQWVDSLFRNSISTDIDEDLKLALDFVQFFGKMASKALDAVTAGLNVVLPSSMQIGGSETKPLPAATKPAPALGAEARDTSLVNAIHQPAWYARYEQVFADRMNALIRTVEGAGAGAPGGRRSSGNRSGKPEAAGSNMGLYRNMGVDLIGGG